MPDELAAQLPITKQVLDALGVIRCEKAGFEADDLLGTISRRADEHGDTCVVVTGDRDSLQLVGGGTTVMLVSTPHGPDHLSDLRHRLPREIRLRPDSPD